MLNKIMLIGNLGKDPEMNYTPSGMAITKFSLAVNRNRKTSTGERQEENAGARERADFEPGFQLCQQLRSQRARCRPDSLLLL